MNGEDRRVISREFSIMEGNESRSSFKLKEEFEDTKWVIRICKSKKNRQHNGQKKKDKRTNKNLQKIE